MSFNHTIISLQARRSPELTLFRGEVAPETGGKVPEAAHMRVELNKLDALGIDDPNAENMIAEMRDMHLPEQMAPGHTPHYDPTVTTTLQTGASSFTPPRGFNFPSNFEDNFGDFPFNPSFDSQKIDLGENEFPQEFIGSGRDFSGNSLDIYEQKPHLFTPDPYEQPDKYNAKPQPVKPVPDPYVPPTGYKQPEPYHPPSPGYHEPEPYHPPSSYHEPEPYHPPSSYHEPEPYHPPSSYHEPEPYHPPSSYHEPEPYAPPKPEYGAPEPGYGTPEPGYGAPEPYKPKAPVMLAHRPYEPKEIKPVTITTHEAYTGFDCRKVPYPDRHYADPEAGCSVSLNCYIPRMFIF